VMEFIANLLSLLGAILAAYPTYRQLDNLKRFNTFLNDPSFASPEKNSFSEHLVAQMVQIANSASENDIFWIKCGVALLILSFVIACIDSFVQM